MPQPSREQREHRRVTVEHGKDATSSHSKSTRRDAFSRLRNAPAVDQRPQKKQATAATHPPVPVSENGNAFAIMTASQRRKSGDKLRLPSRSHLHPKPSPMPQPVQCSALQASEPPSSHKVAPQAQTTPGSDAFAVLCSNAARAFEGHNFFTGMIDGRWRCAIWRKGEPTPADVSAEPQAWSSTSRVSVSQIQSLNGKGKRFVELHLWSNVSSETEPHMCQAPQSEAGRQLQAALQQVKPPGYERYRGGVPLLKSAVQVCCTAVLPSHICTEHSVLQV
jgi:hypothetical protein